MAVRKGYQQTEAGIIPTEWAVKSFGDVVTRSKGKVDPKTSRTTYPCIELEHIVPETGRILGTVESKAQLSLKTTFSKGDTLFGKLRPYLKKYFFADFDGVCSSEIWALKPNRQVDSRFAYYLSQSRGILDAANQSTGTKMPRAEWSTVSLVSIPLPPTKAEQTAIAQALSDTDSLITALEKLIAKKSAIKQGTMQLLLTGKKRLPGFSEEWKIALLGQVSEIKTGKKNNEDKVEDGIFPFFVRSQTVERINSFSYNGEAILVPGEGGIGTIIHYINGRFDYHQRVYKISDFSKQVCGKFIYYCMMQSFNAHATKNSVKATVDSLRLPTFQNFEIKMPNDVDEQEAIAQVLTDMDNEIAGLQEKLDKYKAVKSGMMQQLLTGKIRLL